MKGFNKPKIGFKFNGGRGMVELDIGGSLDIHYKNFNEYISIQKLKPQIKNIIFGTQRIDFIGKIVC